MKKIILCFTIFLITACQKEKIESKEKNIVSFSKEQIEKIGLQHNLLCKEILIRGNFIPTFTSTSKIQNHATDNMTVGKNNVDRDELFQLMNTVFQEYSLQPATHAEYQYYSQYYSPENIEQTINNMANAISDPVLKDIIEQMISKVGGTINHNILKQQLILLKTRAYNELNGTEQTAALVAIEVAIHSSELWSSTSNGGLGYFDQVINNSNTDFMQIKSNSSEKNTKHIIKNGGTGKNIGTVACADAMGAFYGFCRGALPYFVSGGPYNPISNAMLAGQTIIGAVQASTTAALAIALR